MSGIVALLVAAAVAASGSVSLERRLVLMGTEASLRVTAESREVALAGAEAAVRALERTEERLSTWTEESELARLNHSPLGEPVELSPELASELAAALACSRATEGAFDPTVGSLVEAWGLREGGEVPAPPELDAARRAAGADGLALEGRDGAAAVRRTPGLRIEEGGFGKGAALDAALAALGETPGVASAVLDLGGQVAVYARREVTAPAARAEASSSPTHEADARTPIRVGAEPASARGTAAGTCEGPEPASARPSAGAEVAVAHPDRRDLPVAVVHVASGSVATSGNSERGLVVGGERLSHLLDPRTGRPAVDFGSLTVVAPSALEADCLSTGLYVLGPEAAVAWAADRPGIEVLALRRHGAAERSGEAQEPAAGALELLATPGLAGRARLVSERVVESRFGTDQPPARATAAGTKGGAGAEDSVASGRTAPRSRQDRGRRGHARRPHDPEGEYICPLHSTS